MWTKPIDALSICTRSICCCYCSNNFLAKKGWNGGKWMTSTIYRMFITLRRLLFWVPLARKKSMTKSQRKTILAQKKRKLVRISLEMKKSIIWWENSNIWFQIQSPKNFKRAKRAKFIFKLIVFEFSRQKNPTVIRHSDTNYFKLHFLVNDIRHAFHKLH